MATEANTPATAPRTVYKLVRQGKDGNLYPLFIGKDKPFRFGERMDCEFIPTKGFAPRSLGEGNIGGWHCCFTCFAEHLKETKKDGEKRVWIECDREGEIRTYKRSLMQGGDWILCETIIPRRVVPWDEVREMQRKFREAHGMPV